MFGFQIIFFYFSLSVFVAWAGVRLVLFYQSAALHFDVYCHVLSFRRKFDSRRGKRQRIWTSCFCFYFLFFFFFMIMDGYRCASILQWFNDFVYSLKLINPIVVDSFRFVHFTYYSRFMSICSDLFSPISSCISYLEL